jgi:CheY-like chemotaxis protein
MGGAPYSDVTIFYHGLLALLVPLGWALILYPYWRGRRAQWYKTLIFVGVLSFSFMVGKEILIDTEISADDIAADLLGLFFGTGLASLFLYVEKSIALRNKGDEKRAVIPPQDGIVTQNHQAAGASPQVISLRDIMGVLAKIHARGSLLFEEAAGNSTRTSVRELCNRLAAEKGMHAREVESLLTRWSRKAPDIKVLDWMDERVGRYGIYNSPVPADAGGREIVDYAIQQEGHIHTLFSSFHDNFRGYSWRTIQYENMILELKGHGKRLQDLYLAEEREGVVNGPARKEKGREKQGTAPHSRESNVREAAVLVVDDEEGIRTTVAEYLREDGFLHVDTARDGQEALDCFGNGNYDVVIVDIAMPKQHGIEVLRRVKALSPQTQVVVITGKGGKDSAIAALRLGALDYIEKPFDFAVLSRVVSNGLNKKRPRGKDVLRSPRS